MKPKINQFWRNWFKNAKKYDIRTCVDIRYNVIKGYIKGKNILDFCFGSGYFLKRLSSSKNYSLYGIDIHKYMRGLPKNVKTFFIEDLTQLNSINFPIKFDTILVSEVLQHFTSKEINIAFQFFSKWINENGRLIISVPYKEDLRLSTTLCPFCLRWFHPWLHKQSFDENRLRNLLKIRGFALEKIHYITLIDFWSLPSFLKKIINFVLLSFFRRKFHFIVWIVAIAKKSEILRV